MEKTDIPFGKPEDQEKSNDNHPGDKKSLIQIRKHRNLARGTELNYATVPLKDVDLQSPQFEKEVMTLLDKFYGENKVTYKMSGYNSEDRNLRFENTIKQFIEDSDKKEMVIRLHELDENGKTKVDVEAGQYYEQFLTLRKIGERLLIAPTPMIHEISARIHQIGARHLKPNSFDDLRSILREGFKGDEQYKKLGEAGNSVVKEGKDHRISNIKFDPVKTGITKGDRFTLEIFPELNSENNKVDGISGDPASSIVENEVEFAITESPPETVSSINIELDETASEEEKERKMKFYQQEITEKYHVPVRFYIVESAGNEKGQVKITRIFPKKS